MRGLGYGVSRAGSTDETPNPGARTAVISLGAGVQSTTMALMAAEGAWGTVPRYAVFADTQHEPPAVMEHLDWLERELAGRIEVVRVTAGDLAAAATERAYNPIPLFRRGPNGAAQMGRRQCTKEFKLYPLRHWAREQGLSAVEFWVGISLDEWQRAKDTGLKWAVNRWPLLEREMSRKDCIAYLADRVPHPVPKSACYFCPFFDKARLRDMKLNDPESWGKAVAFDRKMNERGEYVHASLTPLDLVDLSTPEDRGQLSWGDECEGMCGV